MSMVLKSLNFWQQALMPNRVASLSAGLLAVFGCCGLSFALAEEATIAVASNFAQPMAVLVEDFERTFPHRIRVVYGSSGRIYAQISNGAPFDGFLSADSAKPEALEAAELAISGSRFTYAIGQLALWSRSLKKLPINEKTLLSGQVSSIALANPRLAPYGLAAEQTLASLGLLDQVRHKLVQGENIAQSYQFVFTGNAQLGFVSHSQLSGGQQAANLTSYWLVPGDLHEPIVQDAVLLIRGLGNLAATQFLSYLASDSAQNIIESYGYKIQAPEKRGGG